MNCLCGFIVLTVTSLVVVNLCNFTCLSSAPLRLSVCLRMRVCVHCEGNSPTCNRETQKEKMRGSCMTVNDSKCSKDSPGALEGAKTRWERGQEADSTSTAGFFSWTQIAFITTHFYIHLIANIIFPFLWISSALIKSLLDIWSEQYILERVTQMIR